MEPWVAPFAVSLAANGGLVHRVLGRGHYFPGGRPALVLDCGGRLPTSAEPVDAVVDGDATCPRCDTAGLQVAPVVVYLARRDGLLKAGHTHHLKGRMASLRAVLLAQTPGTARDEQSLLAAMRQAARPAMGREWFPDSEAVRSAADGWFARRALEVAS